MTAIRSIEAIVILSYIVIGACFSTTIFFIKVRLIVHVALNEASDLVVGIVYNINSCFTFYGQFT